MVIPQFIFTRTPRIYFGAGKFTGLDKIIKGVSKTVLIVTGAHSLKSSGKWDVLIKAIKNNPIKYFHLSVKGEPSPDLIDKAVSEFRSKDIGVVLAIGGGSVIDTAKAISAMLPQNTSVPDIAVVDPELMLSCPPNITAACGMDAFTQLLESYLSLKSTPLTDALAISGLEYLKSNLVLACSTGTNNMGVRTAMAYASLISGITLANAGLGTVHGLASAIGGFFSIPHGVICGTLVGSVTEVNINSPKNKNGTEDVALKKYAKIGALLSGSDSKDINYCCELLIKKISEWTEKLKLPLLNEYGIQISDIDKIVEKAENKNNPVKLNKSEIKKILLMRTQ